MNLLSSPDLQPTLRRFLPRGVLLLWLFGLLCLWGWPNALHAAPSAAPLAQTGCSTSMDVSNTAELNNAIDCYNSRITEGTSTINFTTDITLTTASKVINNNTPFLVLVIDGNNKTLSGANTYLGLEINPNTRVEISALTIRDGKADPNGGGGIRNSGTLLVDGGTLISNTAQFGGGIYNATTGTLSLSYSKLSGNSASNSGGGIYNAGRLTVSNSTLSGNTAPNDGGGIYNEGTLTVSESTLSSNSAQSVGGSIRNEGTLTVNASSLISNTAQLVGGGIYHGSTGTLTVSNSTLSNNKVTGNSSDGGGIYSNGPLTVTNSTLSSNSANDIGGGIYNNSALTLRNTIIANSPKGGDCFNNTGTIAGQTHNLIEDGANACGIANSANSSLIGQDPLLAPLALDADSNLQTHALLTGSPAINKGDDATCAAAPINNRDQIGGIRPIGPACDIGAVEYLDCTFPAAVSTTAELNDAINCYNRQTTAGVYTINFSTDITLDTASRTIDNSNPDVALQINGNNKVLRGANTYRGLAIFYETYVTIAGLTIRDGIGDNDGGGIRNNGTLTVTNSQIISNSAPNGDGGGIDNEGTLTVSNSTLSGNSSTASGGGIDNEGTLTVNNSTLCGNSAAFGGGINNRDQLTVSNSTLSGNSATSGGGIVTSSFGPLTVSNSTLSDNSATSGGGILTFGPVTLNNTIIANSPKGGDCVNDGGTITGQTHNLIEDGANACGITNGTNGSIIGQDPALAPLAFNGGPGPFTHALLATSPAIDQGDAAICAAAPINNLDQLGVIRPHGAACDIGAVEYVPPPVVCTFPATVSTTAELNNAISCYNSQTTAGVYTINFNADITLDITSTVINKPVPGIALQINGNSKALRGANKYRGFEIAPNTNVTIDNLTLVSGKADTSGGGILNRGVLTLSSSLLVANAAPNGDGGGIYNTSTGTLNMLGSTLGDNSALFRGGGLYNEGTLTGNGSFDGNSAESGGGIMNNGTVTVNFSTFGNNMAENGGGGIYNNIDSTLTMSNSYVITNTANNDGGGINNFGTLTVSHSTLRGNKATGGSLNEGGAIYNFGTLNMLGSTLSGNSASIGGGIDNNTNSKLTVSNSTLSGNESFADGGGIFNKGTLTVTNSTLSANNAGFGSGSGIYLHLGALTLRNTIIANSPNGDDCVNNGGTITQTHNLIENSAANACGIANGANGSIIGQDPALAPLTIGNGPQTQALLAASPAIDKGDAAICAAAPINNRDQLGVIRPQGAACDIGAVEFIPLSKRTLTVNKAGSGFGGVKSNTGGIDCGVTCVAVYDLGSTVTLTATPGTGSTFAGWSGACSGTATCAVTLDNTKTVTATFNKTNATTPTLTVSKAGAGTGKVTSNPAGIDCGATCTFAFTQGSSVTLTAAPDAGSTFAGWSGACSGTATTCTVTLDAAKSVVATFNKVTVTTPTLTVSKAGAGTGKVTSSPAGIDCGATCSAPFTQGAAVTLTAAPDNGSAFAGWSGACSGTATSCTVTLDSAKTVTATFNQATAQPQKVYLPVIRR